MAARPSKAMTQPLTVIFRFLQNKARIQIWLYENVATRMEGKIIGFDEFMNVVLDDAEEVDTRKKTRKPLGRVMLKGDNITLICAAPGAAAAAAGAAAGGAAAGGAATAAAGSR